MIYFKTVRYKNFLSTGNVFTELKLNEHKNTLIVGENGAGKTTCLEAIVFGLYGKPLRNINKPNLVNSITQKNLLVEIEFSVGSKEYLVRRGIKPTVFEIICDGQMINQDSQSRDYQEMLETQILKINYKSFSQIVVLSMANYTPFMKLAAANRRQVIEDLLDIQIFTVMNTLLRDKASENKQSISDIEYEVKLINNKIEMHKKHIAELNQNTKDLVKQRKEKIKEYSEQIKHHSKSIKDLEKEIKSYLTSDKDQKKLQARIEELRTYNKEGIAKTSKIRKEIQFYNESETCPTCKQHLDETFKKTTLEKKTKALEEIQAVLPTLEQKIQKLTEQIAEIEKNNEAISKLNKKITDHNIEITTANRFIETLSKEVVDLESKINKTKTDNTALLELRDELASQEKKKEELMVDREVLGYASTLLKDSGIKTRIIKQYIPIMNKLINSYLAKMDFFVQFELDETFKETIKSRFRDEFSYESFSQGEKLRIDLALLFSWRAIAKMRNSASTNLLFMDEILDSSLDSTGIDEFLKIIKNLTSDTNLFIISHRGDQLVDKFDNVLRFEKKLNFSKLVA